MSDAAILLSLLRLPGVGPVSLRKILMKIERAGFSLPELFNVRDEDLIAYLHLTLEQVHALRNPETDAEEDLQECAEIGIEVLLSASSRYPGHLRSLGHNAPLMIFIKGDLGLLQKPTLGVSGSRNADEKNLAALSRICEAVSSQNWVIVSGGARGADEVAHLSAVRSGPGTVIVLPKGILKPNLRRELNKHISEDQSLLISEFPPEQGWTPGCAMQRNRLLVALSRGVILVEPGLRGGTGGTGRLAQKMGVPLYILNSRGKLGEAAEQFLLKGAAMLSADNLNQKELVRQLQHSWEEAEILRRNSDNSLLFQP